jgi:hypothetical protein
MISSISSKSRDDKFQLKPLLEAKTFLSLLLIQTDVLDLKFHDM